jgi:hypothetical protein
MTGANGPRGTTRMTVTLVACGIGAALTACGSSASTLRLTSLVPPSIVFARLRSMPRTSAGSRAARGSRGPAGRPTRRRAHRYGRPR